MANEIPNPPNSRAEALEYELRRRRTNRLEEHADAPEGLTTHPTEMSDEVLEARLNDLYVEALDRDIQSYMTGEREKDNTMSEVDGKPLVEYGDGVYPDDPYNPDNAVHVDELPPHNGRCKARYAYNSDGDRFKVRTSPANAETRLIPEKHWPEYTWAERDVVGDECSECGRLIRWMHTAVIDVNGDVQHYPCYDGES